MDNLKTLLVDDEVEFVMSLAERLKMRDMSADTAFNGEEALSFVQRQAPDVMVLDLKMPGMDGLEVLRQTRKTHPEIQVIMLTGHGTRKQKDEARRLGAFGFLEKPVNIDTLVKEIWAAYKNKVEKTMAAAAYAESGEFETATDLLKEEEPRESGQRAKMTRDQSHQKEGRYGDSGPLPCFKEYEGNPRRAFFVKEQAEQRRYARFQVPGLRAYAVLRRNWPRPPIMGDIIDIGSGGLSFRYTAVGKQPIQSSELDILLTDGSFYLNKVPLKTVSDLEIEGDASDGITARRCCVQFGDLTDDQTSDLRYFIRNYTSADPEG
jgi:CheY-like chemotaxis protein